MNNIKIAVIADDFTGASDAASFLVKGGLKTLMIQNLVLLDNGDYDAFVFALKIRSVEKQNAIDEVKKVLEYLKKYNVEHLYFKYCSTFDSTKEGNIGPILDYLCEFCDEKYSIVCPSLPINGRKVKDGVLYVNGIPLGESHMANHPLNPMWSSFIPSLLNPQSKYPSFTINEENLNNIDSLVYKYGEEYKHFYFVPNYYDDKDGAKIANVFSKLKLLSGGSGLLEHLARIYKKKEILDYDDSFKINKSIVLCGSCSPTTKEQIDSFIRDGHPSYKLYSDKIIDDSFRIASVKNFIDVNMDKCPIIYSDGAGKNMNKFIHDEIFYKKGKKLENIISELALYAYNNSFNNIVIAGGETSGAVTKALNFNAYKVGESVCDGVPFLYPLQTSIRLTLKSGNFGDKDFFKRAIV